MTKRRERKLKLCFSSISMILRNRVTEANAAGDFVLILDARLAIMRKMPCFDLRKKVAGRSTSDDSIP